MSSGKGTWMYDRREIVLGWGSVVTGCVKSLPHWGLHDGLHIGIPNRAINGFLGQFQAMEMAWGEGLKSLSLCTEVPI